MPKVKFCVTETNTRTLEYEVEVANEVTNDNIDMIVQNAVTTGHPYTVAGAPRWSWRFENFWSVKR